VKKLLILAVAVCVSVLFVFPVTLSADTEECLAAPDVAGILLEEAGIDNRYGTGRDGGNFIRDVADKMNEGSGTDFNGIDKCDVEAYKMEVALFLRSKGADVGAELFQAELESVVYEGTCNLFGSHVDDTMTFTFSKDIFKTVDNIKVFFENAQEFWEGWGKADYDISGNVLTVTTIQEWNNPRPDIGDYVKGFENIVDAIGNPVVVPAGGVEVEGIMHPAPWTGTWNAVWDFYGGIGYTTTVTLTQDSSGNVTGNYSYNSTYGTINGTIEGTVDGFDLIGSSAEEGLAYPIEFTMSPDCETFEGTWFDSFNNNIAQGYWNGTRAD